jgi:hypothetical protein
VSNENQKTSAPADAAALAQQLVATPGGLELLRQLLVGSGPSAPVVGMPIHPDDIRAAHARITADLDSRHKRHIADTNRSKGHPAPEVGQTYYAWLAKQVRSGVRTREGIDFAPGQNVKIEVVADDEASAKARRLAGESVVTVDGMERIFEDDTLVINRDPRALVSEDLAAAQAAIDAAEARAAAAERRVAELESEARRNAPDPGDGSPGRLKAAAKARAGAGGEEPPK